MPIGPFTIDRILICSADAGPNSQKGRPAPAGKFFPGAKWVGAMRNAANELGCAFVITTTAHGMVLQDMVIGPYDLHARKNRAEVQRIWEETFPRVLGLNKFDIAICHQGGCPKDPGFILKKDIFLSMGISVLKIGRPNMFDINKFKPIVRFLTSPEGTTLGEIKSALDFPEYMEFFPVDQGLPPNDDKRPFQKPNKEKEYENSRISMLADPASHLADYISTLKDFKFIKPDIPYNHMGATLVDAIFQAGTNYETVVKPRVKKISTRTEAKSTTGFSMLVMKEGIKNLLDWTDDEKPDRLVGLINFLSQKAIEDETGLKNFLGQDGNIQELKKLKGIGEKTVDYLMILSGKPNVAIDRHSYEFLEKAGISITPGDYKKAKNIFFATADKMGIDRSTFDYSVWKYMSKK